MPLRSKTNFIKLPRATMIMAEWLLAWLMKRGINPSNVYAELGLPKAKLLPKEGYLGFEVYNALFEWAAIELDDEFLGIHIAEQSGLAAQGIFGYIQRNSATIGDFCEITERYLSIFQPGAMITFPVINDTCEVRYSVRPPSLPSIRQDVEYTLAAGISFFRKQLGSGWTPAKVFLSHSEPLDNLTHISIFGENIEYNSTVNGFNFDTKYLATPISKSDAKLLKILRKQANQLLSDIEQQDEFIDHVRLVLSASLGQESFGADKTAKALNITRRTLHRRLSKTGTSFKHLKNDLMIELAKEVIKTTNASITEIALQLGYSETSAFVRAFRHLVGVTPLQFRLGHP